MTKKTTKNKTKAEAGARRSDGRVFLAVVDGTEEATLALQYAARLAEANRGHVALLHVMEIGDFQHWSGVEEMARQEMRENAEKLIWEAARKINELNGQIPALYIREGETVEEIVTVINEDSHIHKLVLAAGAHGSAPGPLVSHFTGGKGLARLRVPVSIIPGHLDPQKIDDLT